MFAAQTSLNSSLEGTMVCALQRHRVDLMLRRATQSPIPSRTSLQCRAFKPDLSSSWKDIASEFGSVATLAVQKGATDLTSIIGGAVNTAVSLRGHRDNNLDTPFIPVPGLQRRKTTPMATLSAAISEISTVQGFLQAVLEEKIALGLEIVREDKRLKMRVGEQLQLTDDGIHTGVWFQRGSEKTPGGRLVQFFVEGRLGRCLVEVKEYGHGLPLLPPLGLLVDQSRLRISATIEKTGEVIVLREGPSEKAKAMTGVRC